MRTPHPPQAIYKNVFAADADVPVKVRRDRRSKPAISALICHREWELQCIVKGEGVYFIDGKRHVFAPNTVFVVPPERKHYYSLPPDSVSEKWKVIFRSTFLRSTPLTRALGTLPHQVRLDTHEAATVGLLFYGIRHEIETRPDHWNELARLRLSEMIWMLSRAARRPTPETQASALAQQLLDHIEQYFSQPLSVPELARRFGYSEGHLAHLFKAHAGESIMHYVQRRRILEAKQLLENDPGLTVAAVGEIVGFSDNGRFHRAFKAQSGLTPAMYRRNAHPNRRN